MSSYPKAFSYYLSRMSNYSRQKIRMSAMANTEFTANDQIVFELPQGLLDLTTFTIQGKGTTNNGAGAGVYLPFIEGCIDAYSVEVGGVSIQNGFTNYNDLFNIFRQYQMEDKKNFRKVLQLEEPTKAADGAVSAVPFAMYNFLGFLGSVKVLDTTLLPPVKLYFRLAPNSILAKYTGSAATTFSYKWTDVKATIDIMDISDGVYYNMVNQRLQQAPLEVVFDNYQTVVGSQGTPSQNTRWSTSADCVEGVIATFKHEDMNGNAYNATTKLSDYFTRGTKADNGSITTSVFRVNGISYPSIPCQSADGDIFIDTAHSMNVSHDTVGETDPEMNSLTKWSQNFFVHMHSFTYPDAEDSHRLVGLSGKGNQLIGDWETTGVSGVKLLQPLLWLKCKSILRIGSGKAVEVVL